jgi:hypothetical protein
LGEGGLVGEELQSPGLVGGVQPFEEQATEEPGEDRNGEEKAEPAGDPALAIGRDAASRDDDVSMRMVWGEATLDKFLENPSVFCRAPACATPASRVPKSAHT